MEPETRGLGLLPPWPCILRAEIFHFLVWGGPDALMGDPDYLEILHSAKLCYHTQANLPKRRLTGVNLGDRDPQNRFLTVLANAAA
jgi:hypothetical protein